VIKIDRTNIECKLKGQRGPTYDINSELKESMDGRMVAFRSKGNIALTQISVFPLDIIREIEN
jgi:hypothetical protein